MCFRKMGAVFSKRHRKGKRKSGDSQCNGDVVTNGDADGNLNSMWKAWKMLSNPEVDLLDPEFIIKMMSSKRGEGTYVCTLDERTLAKARAELNEDPTQRAGQIEALRQWVKRQPHINSRTDDEFLLRFLRWSKFSLLRAQEVLDNFWTARTSEKAWFDSMDPADPKLQAVMDLGQQCPLGRDDEGRMVLYVQTGCFEPDELSIRDLLRLGFMTLDVLVADEATQVHGLVYVADFTGFTFGHAWAIDRDEVERAENMLQTNMNLHEEAISSLRLFGRSHRSGLMHRLWTLFTDSVLGLRIVGKGAHDPKQTTLADVLKVGFMQTDVLLLDETNQVHGFQLILDFSKFSSAHVFEWDRDTIRRSSKCWQDVYPTRNKGIHYYNTPMIFNALSEIFMLFMKEKTKKRLHFHKDNLESLHRQIPKRILPEELGGDAGRIKDIARRWKEEMMKHREEFLYNAQFGVDESKRPKPEPAANGGWGGMLGSFRKLNTD